MRELLALVLAALVVAGLGITLAREAAAGEPVPGPKRFGSYEELKNFLKKETAGRGYGVWEERFATGLTALSGVPSFAPPALAAPAPAATPVPAAMATAAPTSSGFSTTNVQVQGVDEADIVKTDGKNLYVVSRGRVFILSAAPPESARVLSRIEPGERVRDLFVRGDRLVVLGESSGYGLYEGPAASRGRADAVITPAPRMYIQQAVVRVYDISRPESPVLKQNVTADGSYFDSRFIGSHLYVIVTDPVRWMLDEVVMPRVAASGKPVPVEAREIAYFNATTTYDRFTTVLSLDISAGGEPRREVFLLGDAQNLYVSPDHLYVSYTERRAVPEPMPMGIRGPSPLSLPPPQAEETVIHKIAIRDGKIRYVAGGRAPGILLNRYSMDQHGGLLRVATTTGEVWSGTSANHVYVLDEGLSTIGRLENLARGERIYSARFMGERLYLVTFQKVDPFFVIDLKDPRSPRVLGELKIPGYSDYLHPYDENHVIGIGKDTVESGTGNFAWYQGLKLALFDVSNVSSPRELAKVVVGDRGTESEALRDPKALLFSRERSLLVLPVDLAVAQYSKSPERGSTPAYGQRVFQGAYVWTLTPERGFEFQGRVTHRESADPAYGFGYGPDLNIRRSLYIGDTLYTVSERMVLLNRLGTLEQVGQVRLA